MNFFGRWPLALVLSSVLLFSGALTVTAQPMREPETLAGAIAAGKVTAVFRGLGGSSGDAVQVTVARTPKAGAGRLVLVVPPGVQLRSSTPSVQDMVIASVRGRMVSETRFAAASEIVVTGTGPVTYLLEAYCSEFEKDNPSDSTTFTLQMPNAALACILREGRGLSMEALQAAVWIQTDRVTYARLSGKFPVSQMDWGKAQSVVAQCASRK